MDRTYGTIVLHSTRAMTTLCNRSEHHLIVANDMQQLIGIVQYSFRLESVENRIVEYLEMLDYAAERDIDIAKDIAFREKILGPLSRNPNVKVLVCSRSLWWRPAVCESRILDPTLKRSAPFVWSGMAGTC